MIRYLNWKGPQGRETIDEFDSSGMDWRAARDERNRLVSEYAMSGMPGAYWSTRMCKNWKED